MYASPTRKEELQRRARRVLKELEDAKLLQVCCALDVGGGSGGQFIPTQQLQAAASAGRQQALPLTHPTDAGPHPP